jgi:hypothetical protein
MKGETIAALIDLSKRRKYTRSLAVAVASNLEAKSFKGTGRAFVAYHVEIDNVLLDFTRVLRQLSKDLESHRGRGHNGSRNGQGVSKNGIEI